MSARYEERDSKVKTDKILFLHKLFRLDNEVLKMCFFLIASLQNLSLCVMILILQLPYVLYVIFDVEYLTILVV